MNAYKADTRIQMVATVSKQDEVEPLLFERSSLPVFGSGKRHENGINTDKPQQRGRLEPRRWIRIGLVNVSHCFRPQTDTGITYWEDLRTFGLGSRRCPWGKERQFRGRREMNGGEEG